MMKLIKRVSDGVLHSRTARVAFVVAMVVMVTRAIREPATYAASAVIAFSAPAGHTAAEYRATRAARMEEAGELASSYIVLDFVVRAGRLYVSHAANGTDPVASLTLDTAYVPERFRAVLTPDHSAIILRTHLGLTADSARVGEPIGAKLGFFWTPDTTTWQGRRSISFEVLHPRGASNALYHTMRVTADSGIDAITIEYRGHGRRRVAEIANALADRYVNVFEMLATTAKTTDNSAPTASYGWSARVQQHAQLPEHQLILPRVQRAGTDLGFVVLATLAAAILGTVVSALMRLIDGPDYDYGKGALPGQMAPKVTS